MSVLYKLQQARVKLQGVSLSKSGHNKYAGYQYFELGDFLPQINLIFLELKLCGVIKFTSSEASLTITDTEDSSEVVITSPSAEVQLKGCTPIQGIGAAQTYLRRYLWVTAMEIVEHDAIDSMPQDSKPQAKRITPLDGAMDALSPELQEMVKDVVRDIVDYADDGSISESVTIFKNAYINDDGTEDVDIKNAIWSMLDSKTRSAMKKFNSEKKEG